MTGAIIGGALIGAGATAYSAHKQSHSAQKASKSSAEAEKYSADLQYKEYEQTRKDYEPWRKAGEEALSKLQSWKDFDFNDTDLENDAGYKFRLEQGENALQNSAASRGMLFSGATAKALTDYAENSASLEYQNAFNRALTKYNTNISREQSLANIGQTANAALSSAGQNYANNVSNLAMQNARVQGNAYMSSGNAYANMASGLAQTANQGISNYLFYKYLLK